MLCRLCLKQIDRHGFDFCSGVGIFDSEQNAANEHDSGKDQLETHLKKFNHSEPPKKDFGIRFIREGGAGFDRKNGIPILN
jgi:hypothetical protein